MINNQQPCIALAACRLLLFLSLSSRHIALFALLFHSFFSLGRSLLLPYINYTSCAYSNSRYCFPASRINNQKISYNFCAGRGKEFFSFWWRAFCVMGGSSLAPQIMALDYTLRAAHAKESSFVSSTKMNNLYKYYTDRIGNWL